MRIRLFVEVEVTDAAPLADETRMRRQLKDWLMDLPGVVAREVVYIPRMLPASDALRTVTPRVQPSGDEAPDER